MSNEEKRVLHIDAIYPERGEIQLSGRVYALGEKIQLQYYKVGYWEECTIRDGVVTFMKKTVAPSQPAPATGQSSVTGFTPADQLKTPSQQKTSKDSSPSMIWCNAMTNAVDLLKAEIEGMPISDVKEMDLAQLALGYAIRFHKAGMEHVKVDQNV